MTWILTNRLDFLKGVLFVLFMSLAIYGCQHINDILGLRPDNPAEQTIEALIKARTGVELDLSPEDER